MKRALFIGRFQSFHNGHLLIINDFINDPHIDEIIIGIGSSQYHHQIKNPFTAKERRAMIQNSITSQKKVHVIDIPDTNDDDAWCSLVETLCPYFDYIFTGNDWVKRIFEEKGYTVVNIEEKRVTSATEIRERINKGAAWEDFVPKGTCEVIKKVQGIRRIQKIFRDEYEGGHYGI